MALRFSLSSSSALRTVSSAPSFTPSSRGNPSAFRRRLNTLWMTSTEFAPDASIASSDSSAQGSAGKVTSKLTRMILSTTAAPPLKPPAAASSTSMCSTFSTLRYVRSSEKKRVHAISRATSETRPPLRVRTA